MSARFQAPRGTSDVLPDESGARARVYSEAAALLARAGYARMETPVFEDTDLFARGVGGSTDIVRKEMFSFEDQGGRSMTLRPEATASICRAYIEHGMHRLPQPVKLWWYGPLFRHERPQAGRFRQFTQLDAEAIGSDSPLVDAELIILLDELLRALGVPALELRLSSLGSLEARAAYREELRTYLRARESELAEDVRERLDENPLRAFDSKDEGTRAVMREAPSMLDRLADDDAEHLSAIRRMLDQADIAYELDATLVRGLDYYTRTVFEFHSEKLGAQSQVAGGGRYDGLVELLGGPSTPACGWAAGLERILLAVSDSSPREPIDVFIVAPEDQRERALALATTARRAGVCVDLDLADRSSKGQMKQADRSGAARTAILREDGSAVLRDMETGEERELNLDDLPAEIERERERDR